MIYGGFCVVVGEKIGGAGGPTMGGGRGGLVVGGGRGAYEGAIKGGLAVAKGGAGQQHLSPFPGALAGPSSSSSANIQPEKEVKARSAPSSTLPWMISSWTTSPLLRYVRAD